MTQQVLALKWRPRNFSEVIGQPHVVQALSNGLDNDRLHHAFLFTGTRGVGKTTLARIFAKSLNCEKGVSSTPCGVCSICKEVDEGRFVDLIEIDAASRTRVEDTREILDNVQYAPTRGRYKIYLIDEVHMLSNSSFNALLKTLEEPPSHVKFLLATTDPQKLPVTVLSRCLRFQLKRIQDQEIAEQLKTILTAEGVPFDEEALKLIAKAGDGSMRDALSLLDQAIAYTGQNVQYQQTHEMLGLIDTQYLERVLTALSTKESSEVIAALETLKANGLDYYRFLEDLIDAFHLLTMIQLSPEFATSESEEFQKLAMMFTAEDLQLFYQVALNGRKDLQNHPNSEVGFEMTLLRMILFAPHAPIGVTEPAQKKTPLIEPSAENKLESIAVSQTAPVVDLPWDTSVSPITSEAHLVSEAGEVSLSVETSEVTDMVISDDLDSSDKVETVTVEPESFEVDHGVRIDAEPDVIVDEILLVDSVESHNSAIDETTDKVIDEVSSSQIEPSVEEVDPNTVSQEIKASDLVNNEAWLSLVSGLSLESVLLGIAHSLVFKSFDGSNLVLERPISVKAFRVDEAEVRLAMAISNKLQADIACKIEYVESLNAENLHERTERLDDERLQKALDDFVQDDVVKFLQNEMGAKLLEKTLKPID